MVMICTNYTTLTGPVCSRTIDHPDGNQEVALTQCEYGDECCMTCDKMGNLVESGECESTLNGNPGCPMVDCLPQGN